MLSRECSQFKKYKTVRVTCRDGDRLFYKGLSFDQDLLTAYPRLMDILADNVKLIDVIERNTGVTKSDIGGRASVFQL